MYARRKKHAVSTLVTAAVATLLMFVSAIPASGLSAGTAGTFDGAFGVNGVAMVPLPFTVPGSVNVDVQGRVVVSGFAVENQVSSLVVARYTSAGHLDPTFGTNGIASAHIPLHCRRRSSRA